MTQHCFNFSRSESRSGYLGKILCFSRAERLIGLLQEVFRALQGLRTGAQLILRKQSYTQAGKVRARRHLELALFINHAK